MADNSPTGSTSGPSSDSDLLARLNALRPTSVSLDTGYHITPSIYLSSSQVSICSFSIVLIYLSSVPRSLPTQTLSFPIASAHSAMLVAAVAVGPNRPHRRNPPQQII